MTFKIEGKVYNTQQLLKKQKQKDISFVNLFQKNPEDNTAMPTMNTVTTATTTTKVSQRHDHEDMTRGKSNAFLKIFEDISLTESESH